MTKIPEVTEGGNEDKMTQIQSTVLIKLIFSFLWGSWLAAQNDWSQATAYFEANTRLRPLLWISMNKNDIQGHKTNQPNKQTKMGLLGYTCMLVL